MKKLLSLVVVFVLLLNLFVLPSGAMTVDEKKVVDAFAASVTNMEELDQFFDGIGLVLQIEDVDGIVDAYTNAFDSMSTTNQSRMQAYKLVADISTAIALDLKASGKTIADFEADCVNAKTLAAAMEADYPTAYKLIVAEEAATVTRGITQADKIFDILNITTVLKVPFMLTNEGVTTATVDEDQAEAMLLFVNTALGEDLTDFSSLIGSIDYFITYFKASSKVDKNLLFNYLENYGFFKKIGSLATGEEGFIEDEFGNIIIKDEVIAQFGLGFRDLGAFNWASAAILALNNSGIVNGIGSGMYNPAGNVSRAEFATMLVRLLDLKSDNNDPFTDVSAADWYSEEVTAAYEAGLIMGVGNDLFLPTNYISRQEIAVMIGRAIVLNGGNYPSRTEIGTILSVFTDGVLIEDWATASAALVVEEGIITGIPVGNGLAFNPEKHTTRAEVAVMLYRLSDVIDTVIE